MKRNQAKKTNLAMRLSTYTASTSALLAIGMHASGQVEYSGLKNMEMEFPNDSIELDLDGDLTIDFKFFINGYLSASSYGTVAAGYGVGYGIVVNPRTSLYQNSWLTRSIIPGPSGEYSESYPIPHGLFPGESVDPANTNWSNIADASWIGALGVRFSSYYRGGGYSVSNSWSNGDFLGKERFLGVRFYIGTEQHYGWVRVKMADDVSLLTLVDWAYETTADTGIETGEGSGIDFNPILEIKGANNTNTPLTTLRIITSELISGLELTDFIVVNGSALNLIEVEEGLEFTVDVTAFSEGEVSFAVMADAVEDAAMQGNDFSEVSWNYDISIPIGEFSHEIGISPFDNVSLSLKFGERVLGLDIEDFIVQNGFINALSSQGSSSFELSCTANGPGLVEISLPAGSVSDGVGNENEEISTSWTYSNEPPVATIDISGIALTNDKIVTIPISFSQEIVDLELNDFNITNGEASNLIEIVNSLEYTLDVTATEEGVVTIELKEDAVMNMASQFNEAVIVSYTYEEEGSGQTAINGVDRKFSVYPNPANTLLNVELSQAANIKLIGIKGNVVYQGQNILSETINISNLKSGVYIFQFIMGDQVYQERIIKE